MGRTVLSFTQVIHREKESWSKFRRALRREDQGVFDVLFEKAKLHTAAGAYLSRPSPMEVMFLSMLLEHQKALDRLEAEVRRLETRLEELTNESAR